MEYKNRIESNPKIMLGKPVIKGTRITVELILQKISDGMEINELLISYPNLKKDDILAAILELEIFRLNILIFQSLHQFQNIAIIIKQMSR